MEQNQLGANQAGDLESALIVLNFFFLDLSSSIGSRGGLNILCHPLRQLLNFMTGREKTREEENLVFRSSCSFKAAAEISL